MPLVVVTCPQCETRLETGAENVGRSGQCPACDAIFAVRVTADARWAREGPAGPAVEYGNAGTMSVPVVMGACLVLMVVAALVRWVDPSGSAAAFVAVERSPVVGVSLACLLALGISGAARVSLGPAVLAAGTWGVAAAVLLFGLARCLVRAAGADGTFAPMVGLYVALGGGVLAAAGTAHGYVRYRRAGVLRRPTLLCASAAGLGAAIGLVTLAFHTGPGCEAALDLARAARGRRAETPGAVRTSAPSRRPTRVAVAPAPSEPGPSEPAAGEQPVPAAEPGVGSEAEAGTGGTKELPLGEEGPRARRARAWIWVEGEDAAEDDCLGSGDYKGIARHVLSGNEWLSHYPGLADPPRSATVRYSFRVQEAGTYSAHVRVAPISHACIEFRLDEGDPIKIPPAMVDSVRVAGAEKAPVFVVWVDLGRHRLAAGTHVVTMTLCGWVGPFLAIDCMAFTNFDWTPAGKRKPSQASGRRRAGASGGARAVAPVSHSLVPWGPRADLWSEGGAGGPPAFRL